MSPGALHAVIARIASNDRDVLRDQCLLSQLASRSEWSRIEEAADTLERMWRDFDWLRSPDFEA